MSVLALRRAGAAVRVRMPNEASDMARTLRPEIPAALLADRRLTDSSVRLYCYLAWRAESLNPPDVTQAEIADKVGMNVTTVKNATRLLCKCGWLGVIKSGRWGTWRYFPLDPSQPVRGSDVLDEPHRQMWNEIRTYIKTGK